MSYIEAHCPQIEAEYQEVLQTRKEIRQYWEDRNRERLAQMATMPHKPEQEAFWAKLEEQRAKRTAGHLDRLSESEYRERCAERLIEIAVDLDNYKGVGRLFIP